ncbi:MAG: Holliday junction resolvase RuvX [Acholeplasmataceae bacterium]|nr:MAG: Holliday junction resolvase RuvX [Acholeplasmataceae bacterium]
MKRYLGLDLGSRTLGVALSESGIIAHALDTHRFPDGAYGDAIDIIISLIDAHDINVVVLGYPKHMNNDVGIRGKISESVREGILTLRPIEVVLWDERLSTQTAIKTMVKADQSRKTQKQKKDALAAVIILQNYLDYQSRT